MPNPALPHGLQRKEELVPTTLSLDGTNLAWLDELAEATGRSRSEVARTILDSARKGQTERRVS